MVLKLLKRTLSLSLPAVIYCLIVSSCSIFIIDDDFEQAEQKSSQTIYISGNIDSSGRKSSSQLADTNISANSNKSTSSERTAVPDFLTSSSLSSDYEYFVYAKTTESSSLSANGTVENGCSYTIALKTGYTWKITAGIRRKSDNKEIMLDTATVTLSNSNPILSIDFVLKPVSGNGEIELPINIDSSIPVSKIYVSIGDQSRVAMSDTSAIKFDSFAAGSYNAVIELYDSSDVLVYSFIQVINVFPYLKTNQWIISSSSGLSTDSSGNLKITSSMTESWKRNVFYVAQNKLSNGSLFQTSDDDNDGSPYKPFKTISKAIEKIKECGNSSSDYTIYVKGTITDHITVDFDNYTIKSLLIKSYKDDSSAIDGNGNSVSNKSVFTINTEVPVTINGLTVQNGSSPNGGGIYLQKGSLELVKCNISNNSATIGGGIYIEKPDSDSAQIRFSETSIANNTATQGGGIYNKNTDIVITDGCLIDSNTATLYGGGIASETEIAITGGSLTNNKAVKGGAIYYCGSGTGSIIVLGTNTYIPSGTDDKKNDIYVQSGNTVNLAGALSVDTASVTLTPEDYTIGTTLLSGEEAFIKSEYSKLSLSNSVYCTSKYGKIRLKNSVTELNINQSSGSDDAAFNSISSSPTFQTITRALQFITFQNDDEADYTIYINGTFTGTNKIPAEEALSNIKIDETTAKSILLEGVNYGTLNGIGDETAPVLHVQNSVPVTIKNLTITNGHCHGLKVDLGTKVFLGEGAKINGNKTKDEGIEMNGGGVVVESTGELYMYADAIIGQKATVPAEEDSYSNYAARLGGGIYCNSGKVYIGYKNSSTPDTEFTGGVIYNYANTQGAGIYSDGTAEINIYKGYVSYNRAGKGGAGIRCGGTDQLNISGGNISYNIAATNGGGVYVGGSSYFTLKGGEISNNEAEKGGAVYNNTGALILKNSAYIPCGSNIKNDVYLPDSAVITVEGSLAKTGIIATITPSDYTDGKTLLSVSSGTSLEDAISHFNVTPYVDSGTLTITNYDINNHGELYKLEITLNNAVSVISKLTGNSTLKISGPMSSAKFAEIREALLLLPSSAQVSLDLSEITGMVSLPSHCFEGCEMLYSITIPNTVTTIEENAFAGCKNLFFADLPANLERINKGAFSECSSLGSVTIPASVTTIGQNAYTDCTGLSKIIYNDTKDKLNSIIGTDCFKGTPAGLIAECTEGNFRYDEDKNTFE